MYQSYKSVVYQNLESLLRPLVRSLLACVDLIGDAIYSVVLIAQVAGVRPMVNNILYHKLLVVFKLTVNRAF